MVWRSLSGRVADSTAVASTTATGRMKLDELDLRL